MSASTFEIPDVECDAETDMALHIIAGDEQYWVPKSQVHDDSEVYKKGHEGLLVVSEWWANKQGLI